MLAAAALAGAVTGCVTTTTRYFVPTAGAERITETQLRDRGDALLKLECPRLMNGGTSASGETEFAIDVATDGGVARARVEHSSGDERIDQLFGALVAQVTFDPVASPEKGMVHSRLGVGYACSPTVSAVTVRLEP